MLKSSSMVQLVELMRRTGRSLRQLISERGDEAELLFGPGLGELCLVNGVQPEFSDGKYFVKAARFLAPTDKSLKNNYTKNHTQWRKC